MSEANCRSVLTVDVVGGRALPWPPPSAEVVPDVVVITAENALTDEVRALVRDAGRLGSTVIVDGSAPATVTVADDGVAAIRCWATSLHDVQKVLREIGDSPLGIEVIVVHPTMVVELPGLTALSDRIWGIAIAPERLADALGVVGAHQVDNLSYARGRVLQISNLIGVPAIGRCGHVDGRSQTWAEFSSGIGFSGGLCSDWNDVRQCNEGFRPTPPRLAQAVRIIDAMNEAAGQGLAAVTLDGRMVDIPFIAIAERTVRMARQIEEREQFVRSVLDPNGGETA